MERRDDRIADGGKLPLMLAAVSPESAYGRQLLAGVGRYRAAHLSVDVLAAPTGVRRRMRESLPRVDGVLTYGSRDPERMEQLGRLGVPVVLTTSSPPHPGLAVVCSDGLAVGQMATAFFRDQGLRDLAYCGGGPLWQFSSNRKRGFIDAGEAAGLSVSDWVPPPALLEHWSESGLIESLAGWIAGLPRPCGVLCPSDEVAHYALTAARAARRRVPEDLAVLGVDNDEVLCELSSPALASIDQGAEKIGYAAAELLDRLMRGEAVPESPVVVPPTRVVSRRSAELLAVDDPAVSGALAFIRERFGEPIQVQDVADHVAVSRSSLQRRFRERMDRTVHQELVRVRMERAKLLLLETDQTLPQIAAACGLNYGSHLSLLFRRVTGQSPSTFRAQRR